MRKRSDLEYLFDLNLLNYEMALTFAVAFALVASLVLTFAVVLTFVVALVGHRRKGLGLCLGLYMPVNLRSRE